MSADGSVPAAVRSGWFTGIVLLLAFGGCTGLQRTAPPPLSDRARAQIRARADDRFATAVLVKPAETGQTNEAAFTLAPLIIQEVTSDRPESLRGDQFGRLTGSIPTVSLDDTLPSIYFRQSQVLIHDKPHEQTTYFWFYPAGATAETHRGLPVQGVRITLDSAGSPVIWEVLADTSDARIIYVSRSLETAAHAEFGPALAGRRFAIEPDCGNAPNTVVARVIEDGPAPMGPILHLQAGTRDVNTVICRCMPAQTTRLAGQGYYELVPASIAPAEFLVRKARTRAGIRTAFWPDGTPSGHDLERQLRLPSHF